MSLPSFPVVNPPIEREDAVNQILSSIAMEELGLSHILNAEGEKLQYILGTLPGLSGPPATVSDVLAANESVRSMLETAAQNQLFLKAKMQGALTASPMQGPTGATGPTGASGPTGATGPNLTSTAGFAANTQGSSVLVINGVNSIPSTINPVVSTSNFENQIKVTLPANSTITLQLFTTIAGTAILVSGGAGASLTIIRLS